MENNDKNSQKEYRSPLIPTLITSLVLWVILFAGWKDSLSVGTILVILSLLPVPLYLLFFVYINGGGENVTDENKFQEEVSGHSVSALQGEGRQELESDIQVMNEEHKDREQSVELKEVSGDGVRDNSPKVGDGGSYGGLGSGLSFGGLVWCAAVLIAAFTDLGDNTASHRGFFVVTIPANAIRSIVGLETSWEIEERRKQENEEKFQGTPPLSPEQMKRLGDFGIYPTNQDSRN